MSLEKVTEQSELIKSNDNKKQTLDNLNLMLNDIKNGEVSEDKMNYIVDYIWNLAGIESRYKIELESKKVEMRLFIKESLNDRLSNHFGEYNISKFDVDGQVGLDKIEEENYGNSIQEAIKQIIILGGVNRFSQIHSESASKDGIDKYIASLVNLQKAAFGEKGSKHFMESAIQKYGMIDEVELKKIQEKQFDITKKESWGDLSLLFVKEFGDGAEDALRFIGNIPSGIVLIPRYTSYRIDLNSDNLERKTEAEIKIKELMEENPSLMLLEMFGEKGITMIKQLGGMLTSGTQGDIATMMVSIIGLLAGGAGALKLGLNLTRKTMAKSARSAGRDARIAGETSSRTTRNSLKSLSSSVKKVGDKLSKVDDIVSGAGIGYMTSFGRQLSPVEEYNRSLLYNDGFESTIRQGEVGTCYFLSSLEMTKSNQLGKLNLLNMIERHYNNGLVSYNIRFPGGEKSINISESELAMVKDKGFGLKKGSLGDDIITVAHMKYMYENSDLFKEKNIPFEEYIKNHERKRYADMVFESGQEADAIKLLWGEEKVIVDYFYLTKDGIGFNKGEMFPKPKGLAKTSNNITYDDLSKFFNEGAMIGAGTKRKGHPGTDAQRESLLIQKDFYGNDVKVLGPHAYWVKNVDSKNGFIEVSEPFNSSKVVRFTLEQFNSIFNSITLVRQRK